MRNWKRFTISNRQRGRTRVIVVNGKILKIVSDMMRSTGVKEPVRVSLGSGGSICSGLGVGRMKYFEAGSCCVTPFVAPLADIIAVSVARSRVGTR